MTDLGQAHQPSAHAADQRRPRCASPAALHDDQVGAGGGAMPPGSAPRVRRRGLRPCATPPCSRVLQTVGDEVLGARRAAACRHARHTGAAAGHTRRRRPGPLATICRPARRLGRSQHALRPHGGLVRHDQHVAGCVGHDLRDHLAHQQIRQEAALAAAADDDQVAAALARLVDDLLGRARRRGAPQVDRHAGCAGPVRAVGQISAAAPVGLRGKLRRHGFVLGVAQPAASRPPAAAGSGCATPAPASAPASNSVCSVASSRVERLSPCVNARRQHAGGRQQRSPRPRARRCGIGPVALLQVQRESRPAGAAANSRPAARCRSG